MRAPHLQKGAQVENRRSPAFLQMDDAGLLSSDSETRLD